MKEWFLHIQGETVGPLLMETILNLLKLSRITLVEFAWSEGMEDWTRLSEIHEFASQLPPHPTIPVPNLPSRPRGPVPSAFGASPVPRDLPSKESRIRRFERVPIQGRAVTDEQGTLEIVDISEGGIFVKSDLDPPEGTSLRLRIESALLVRPLTVTGVVVRGGVVNGTRGFGVEFTGMPPSDRMLIQTYVRAVRFGKGNASSD